jgi:hypothetical protein
LVDGQDLPLDPQVMRWELWNVGTTGCLWLCFKLPLNRGCGKADLEIVIENDHVAIAIEHGPVEIVDLPINGMVDLSIVV